MKATPSAAALRKELESVRRALLALGPIHPGSVSMQYQVCGRPGCRCADPENPRRHGPYPKLSYVHRGRRACRFVRADSLEEVRRRTEAYRRFRGLIDRWIEISVLLAGTELFPPSPAPPRPRRSAARPARPGPSS